MKVKLIRNRVSADETDQPERNEPIKDDRIRGKVSVDLWPHMSTTTSARAA